MQSTDLAYETFLESVQPFAVVLDSCIASLARSLFWKLRENQKTKVTNKLTSEYRLLQANDAAFDVRGSVTIKIGDEVQEPLELRCEFTAHFHSSSDVPKGFAERFSQSEARVFMWPYFREFISATTSRMGMTSPHVE